MNVRGHLPSNLFVLQTEGLEKTEQKTHLFNLDGKLMYSKLNEQLR